MTGKIYVYHYSGMSPLTNRHVDGVARLYTEIVDHNTYMEFKGIIADKFQMDVKDLHMKSFSLIAAIDAAKGE